MKKLITINLLFVISLSHAQEISRSTNSSAGASAKNDQGYSIDWTMGAQFSHIVKDRNYLTEGFQQGDLLKKTMPIEQKDLRRSDHQSQDTSLKHNAVSTIAAYPNPTTERLYLEFEQENFSEGSVKLFDQNGKMIAEQIINPDLQSPIEINNIRALAPGTYLLQVISPIASASLKFVKVK